MPVVLKQEPAPAAAPALNITDTLDTGETVVSETVVSTLVNTAPEGLNVLSNQMASEGFALVMLAVIVYLIVRFILSFLPNMIIIGIGFACLYAYLK